MAKRKPSTQIEFKNKAVSLMTGKTDTTRHCDAMGIGYTALKRWLHQLESAYGGMTPGQQ